MKENPPKETGVYFRTKDYGSLFKRFVVIGVDTFVLVVAGVIISFIWAFFIEEPDLPLAAEYGGQSPVDFNLEYLIVLAVVSWLYLAVAKRSEKRTVGYRMTGLRVVDLQGKRPSLIRMTWRFVLLLFGPINLIIDIFWLGGDENRQTLRDKISKTYVVKEGAQPVGSGPIEYADYYLLGLSLVFTEVKRPKQYRQNYKSIIKV